MLRRYKLPFFSFVWTLCALPAVGMGADAVVLQLELPGDKAVTSLHFGVNCEFFRPGLFFGTLPASDPRSKRKEFAQALIQSGIRALRFPGGDAAYYYLPESREASMTLGHAIRHWEFQDAKPGSSYFVRLEHLAEFCREYDIHLVYELPILFYLDGETPRAVIKSRLSEKAGNYDRERISEGAAYARRIVDRLQEFDAPVAVWELGNEEFAFCESADYGRVCSAYAAAIREAAPRARIVAVGMGKGWLEGLVPALRRSGGLPLLAGMNAHYPFSHWFGPGDPARRGDANAFVSGDLRMERWLDSAAAMRGALGIEHIPISVTETTVMRHQNWDPHAVVGTHAHALVYAWNWSDLLMHPLCDMAVFHDLETPFFGMMRFDVGYDPERRRFEWLQAADANEKLIQFPGQYVLSPTGLANRLLSRLAGCRMRRVRGAEGDTTIRVLGGSAEGRVVIVLINRCPERRAIRAEGVTIAEATALTADSLSAVLPGAYGLQRLPFTNTQDDAEIVLPAWSVVGMEGKEASGAGRE